MFFILVYRCDVNVPYFYIKSQPETGATIRFIYMVSCMKYDIISFEYISLYNQTQYRTKDNWHISK